MLTSSFVVQPSNTSHTE